MICSCAASARHIRSQPLGLVQVQDEYAGQRLVLHRRLDERRMIAKPLLQRKVEDFPTFPFDGTNYIFGVSIVQSLARTDGSTTFLSSRPHGHFWPESL